MKDRIRQIRKDLDMTQTEFGHELGASQKMITTFETGRVIPDKTIIMLICEKFHVNQTWLETGEGEPYKAGGLYSVLRLLDAMPALQKMLEKAAPRLSLEDIKAINAGLEKIMQEDSEEE